MLITLVGFAFFFGILLSRLGLPPMVGFLVAGFAYNLAGFETPSGLQLFTDRRWRLKSPMFVFRIWRFRFDRWSNEQPIRLG